MSCSRKIETNEPGGVPRYELPIARVRVHCRTLDLLHIAVMDACGADCLFTIDQQQAAMAKALGMTVVDPRRGVA